VSAAPSSKPIPAQGENAPAKKKHHTRAHALPYRTVATTKGDITELDAAPNGAVYAVVPLPSGQAQVVRYAPGSGRLTLSKGFRAAPIQSGNSIAVRDGSVWFAGYAPRGKHRPRKLWRLDPNTLATEGHVEMPASPSAVVATPSGLWVGAGDRLIRLDGAGHLVDELSVAGPITHMALDPSGSRLYVATDTQLDKTDFVVFEERSASTGALLASAKSVGFWDLGGPTSLAPVDAGVWVSQPTGMMGALELFRADDLASAGTGPGAQGSGVRTGTNEIDGSAAAGLLWISDYQRLVCADPSTGKTIAPVGSQDATGGIRNVVAVPAGMFTVSATHIVQLKPGIPCLSDVP
jgi:hypothetical protein